MKSRDWGRTLPYPASGAATVTAACRAAAENIARAMPRAVKRPKSATNQAATGIASTDSLTMLLPSPA